MAGLADPTELPFFSCTTASAIYLSFALVINNNLIYIFAGFCLLQLLLKGYINEHRTPIRYKLLLVMAVGFLVIGTFIFGESMTQTVWTDIKYGTNKPGKQHGICP